jgi:hypothetical protein
LSAFIILTGCLGHKAVPKDHDSKPQKQNGAGFTDAILFFALFSGSP